MRRSLLPLVCTLAVALACRSTSSVPVTSADAVYEGRVDGNAITDTIEAKASVGIERARWTLRDRPSSRADFWTNIALLDIGSADLTSRSVEQRTFAAALRTLMGGEPDAAAVAFEILRATAKDSLVQARARVGLTMALSWHSDWSAMARIAARTDSVDPNSDSNTSISALALAASVERWAHAFSMMPVPEFIVPDEAVVLPMRRSAFGTPVITVKINGRPHQFWLDTGASMTLLTADVAIEAGVRLAAADTLALGVVAGHVEARAAYIDSLSIGPVVVRGLGAAIVTPDALRFDQHVVEGKRLPIRIDGMIGTDVLRHLDVVLDAGAETITIRRPRRLSAPTRNLFWVGYPVIRLVTEDGHPVLFGLDTGAEATYVTSTLLKKMPRTRLAARRVTLTGIGSEHKVSGWVARDVPLSDGNYAIDLRNVPIMPEQRWTFVNFDGVIGSDVALATRMHLDFTNGLFDIRSSAALSKPTKGALEGAKVF
ncbi:MAG: hypothetical protein JWL95_2733 [Gemmatimonadetes bacterium]|nr:hypothetical protein [Gemmatimonadota bacterium]